MNPKDDPEFQADMGDLKRKQRDEAKKSQETSAFDVGTAFGKAKYDPIKPGQIAGGRGKSRPRRSLMTDELAQLEGTLMSGEVSPSEKSRIEERIQSLRRAAGLEESDSSPSITKTDLAASSGEGKIRGDSLAMEFREKFQGDALESLAAEYEKLLEQNGATGGILVTENSLINYAKARGLIGKSTPSEKLLKLEPADKVTGTPRNHGHDRNNETLLEAEERLKREIGVLNEQLLKTDGADERRRITDKIQSLEAGIDAIRAERKVEPVNRLNPAAASAAGPGSPQSSGKPGKGDAIFARAGAGTWTDENHREFKNVVGDRHFTFAMSEILLMAFKDAKLVAGKNISPIVTPAGFIIALLNYGLETNNTEWASLPAKLVGALNCTADQVAKLRERLVLPRSKEEQSDSKELLSQDAEALLAEMDRLRSDCSIDLRIAARHATTALLSWSKRNRRGFLEMDFDEKKIGAVLSADLIKYAGEDRPDAWARAIKRSGIASLVTSPPAKFKEFAPGNHVNVSRRASATETCLNAKQYAHALAKLFRCSDEGEFSLGVFGHWGRGKTFLMEEVEKAINDKKLIQQIASNKPPQRSPDEPQERILSGKFETVFFSAWRYPSRPEVWVNLYQTIFETLRSTGWCRSIGHVLKVGVARHGIWKLLGIWLALWFTALPKGWFLSWLSKDLLFEGRIFSNSWRADVVFAVLILAFGILFIRSFWHTKSALLSQFMKAPDHSEKLGLQATIGKDVRALLTGWVDVDAGMSDKRGAFVSIAWPNIKGALGWCGFWILIGILCGTIIIRADIAVRLSCLFCAAVIIPALAVRIAFGIASAPPQQLLLVIDDLDRCQFDHLLSVVESIKLLLEDKEISKRVRVAILVEEDVLKHALWHKYMMLTDEDSAKELNTDFGTAQIIRENCEKLLTAHLRLSALTPDEVEEVVAAFAKVRSAPAKPTSGKPTKPEVTAPGGRLNPSTISNSQLRSAMPSTQLPQTKTNPHTQSEVQSSPSSSGESVRRVVTLDENEKTILIAELKELKMQLKAGLGPRAIRSFLFRYQLARLILEELNSPVQHQDQVVELAKSIALRSLGSDTPSMVNPSSRIQQVVAQVT